MKTTRLFRWIWRFNAIAILLVALAAVFGIGAVVVGEIAQNRRRSAEAAAAPVVKQADAELRLGVPRMIPGTDVLRADLQAVDERAPSLSSYDSTVTHNILFIETNSGRSRWLLPSHRRIVEETNMISAPDDPGESRAPLASAALIKDAEDSETGDLLLFDPTGARIMNVSAGVRRIHSATATSPSLVLLVFERGGKYVLARFDAPSLRKVQETELQVPRLP
jgi:hypothetical protein